MKEEIIKYLEANYTNFSVKQRIGVIDHLLSELKQYKLGTTYYLCIGIGNYISQYDKLETEFTQIFTDVAPKYQFLIPSMEMIMMVNMNFMMKSLR